MGDPTMAMVDDRKTSDRQAQDMQQHQQPKPKPPRPEAFDELSREKEGVDFGHGLRVVDLDMKRGRGVVATERVQPGATLYRALPTLSVLYTDHVATTCARCFTREGLTVCPTCDSFALCSACGGEGSHAPLESTTGEWGTHRTVCQWFMTLPADVRKGDTDHVRFLLQFAARAQQGDAAMLSALLDCCALEDAQSAKEKQFASGFARITVNQFAPHGMNVAFDTLRQLLLKVKVNALGFPFSASETLGWSMEGFVCALNHSCAPNAIIKQGTDGQMLVEAARAIEPGQEVCIAYVHLPDYPDTRSRRRALLEKYRFLCDCPMCAESTTPMTSSTPSEARTPTRRQP